MAETIFLTFTVKMSHCICEMS